MKNQEYQARVEKLMQDINQDIITEGEALELLEDELLKAVVAG